MRNIKEDEFYESFELVKNTIDKNAAWGGFMFETYGEEFEFVKSRASCAWTILEEDGYLLYLSGIHFVNRIGYLITTAPPTEETVVILYEDKEEDIIIVELD